MRLVNMSALDIAQVYKMYSEGYPEYFRHFDEFLSEDQFIQTLISTGNLVNIRSENVNVGFLHFRPLSKAKICEVSVFIAESSQGEGHCVEAMLSFFRHIFKSGFKRIVCLTSSDDPRAMALCEKGGFEEEAVLVESCYYEGEFHNETRWVMTKKNFNERYGG